MNVFLIIATLALFGILIFFVIKGINPVFGMLLIGFAVLIPHQFITGVSILGEGATGNYIGDLFVYIRSLCVD